MMMTDMQFHIWSAYAWAFIGFLVAVMILVISGEYKKKG